MTIEALHHLEIENIFCVIETRRKFERNENLRTKANKIVNNVVSSKLLSPFHTTKLSLTNFTCQNDFSPYKLGIFDIENSEIPIFTRLSDFTTCTKNAVLHIRQS